MENVLIVEDQSQMRKLMCFYLSSAWKISEAHNGLVAYSMLLDGEYDIIISDINMPEMDGVELLNILSRADLLNNKRFYFSSTEVLSEKDLTRFRKLGLSGYIRKPFTKDELRNLISQ